MWFVHSAVASIKLNMRLQFKEGLCMVILEPEEPKVSFRVPIVVDKNNKELKENMKKLDPKKYIHTYWDSLDLCYVVEQY